MVEPGPWLSADLHVHSGLSDDSALPVRPRIAAFAAEGADVIVSTEHDQVSDYAPLIRSMGLADRMASIVGSEITSTVKSEQAPFTIGHSNAFPLVPRRDEYRNGAPDGESRRIRTLLAELRALPSEPLLQLNHPRAGAVDAGLGSYFSHLAVPGEPFDPTMPLEHGANAALSEKDPVTGLRDLDYHAIELLNGSSMARYRIARADWFSLLLQGEFKTGTGNSDSHDLETIVALPRNYVAYTGPKGSELDEPRFMASLRAGQLYVSTGPLLDVRLGDSGPGETFRGSQGVLFIEVRAAPWVPVDEARVFVDGALHSRHLIRSGEPLSLPLDFLTDGFVSVEIEGTTKGERAEIYRAVAPGFTPFAFTNPIRVDHDSDGQWAVPGLPDSLPDTLVSPLTAP
jgi:hypothetical protein